MRAHHNAERLSGQVGGDCGEGAPVHPGHGHKRVVRRPAGLLPDVQDLRVQVGQGPRGLSQGHGRPLAHVPRAPVSAERRSVQPERAHPETDTQDLLRLHTVHAAAGRDGQAARVQLDRDVQHDTEPSGARARRPHRRGGEARVLVVEDQEVGHPHPQSHVRPLRHARQRRQGVRRVRQLLPQGLLHPDTHHHPQGARELPQRRVRVAARPPARHHLRGVRRGAAVHVEVPASAHDGRRAGDPLSAHVPLGRGRRPVRERPGRVHQGQVRRVRGLRLARQRLASTRLLGVQQAQADTRAIDALLHANAPQSAAAAAPKGRHTAHCGRRGAHSTQEEHVQGPGRDDARLLCLSRVSESVRLPSSARKPHTHTHTHS